MESLFDLGIPERVVGKRNVLDDFIKRAWSRWEEATERPKSREPDYRFRKAVRDTLDQRHSEERIMRAISAAAYMRPKGRDPMDVRRVIATITKPDIERQMLALLDSSSEDVKPFMWDSGDPESNLCTVDQIAEACGVPIVDWTGRDHECSGMIMSSIDNDKLRDATRRVSIFLGYDNVTPAEIIRHSSVWRNPDKKVQVKRNASRDTYNSGRAESDKMKEVDISLDSASGKALINGCPPELINEHYLKAPDGYWEKVEEEVDKDFKSSLSDIYDRLRETENWHPDDRGELTW